MKSINAKASRHSSSSSGSRHSSSSSSGRSAAARSTYSPSKDNDSWKNWSVGDKVEWRVNELGETTSFTGKLTEMYEDHAIVEAGGMKLWLDKDSEKDFIRKETASGEKVSTSPKKLAEAREKEERSQREARELRKVYEAEEKRASRRVTSKDIEATRRPIKASDRKEYDSVSKMLEKQDKLMSRYGKAKDSDYSGKQSEMQRTGTRNYLENEKNRLSGIEDRKPEYSKGQEASVRALDGRKITGYKVSEVMKSPHDSTGYSYKLTNAKGDTYNVSGTLMRDWNYYSTRHLR